MRSHRAAPQAALIAHLNPVIRGWCRFYSSQTSKRTFSSLSASLFAILQRWARRRHPKKNRHWVNRKYWHSLGNAHWVFAAAGEDPADEFNLMDRLRKIQPMNSHDKELVFS